MGTRGLNVWAAGVAGCVLFVTGGRAWLGALVPRDVPGRSAIAASFLGVGFSPASVRGGVGYMFRTGLALVDNLRTMHIAKDGGWVLVDVSVIAGCGSRKKWFAPVVMSCRERSMFHLR